MFTWLIRSSFRLMALAAIGFVAVTLPVGRRTLFEHAVAILSTEPAHELGEDLSATGHAVKTRIASGLQGNPLSQDDAAPSASARD